jgi:hypothetical protein
MAMVPVRRCAETGAAQRFQKRRAMRTEPLGAIRAVRYVRAMRGVSRTLVAGSLAATLGCAGAALADHLSQWPEHGGYLSPGESVVSLYSHDLQPISRHLGIRVEDASVKDQRLTVIGELTNASRVTYDQVRLVIGIEHGAEQRITVGRLVPGGSRRVQLKLATDFPHAPPHLRVMLVEATADYRPKPQHWPRLP